MSETFIAPLVATDVPADWIAIVRETAQRDGHAVRAGAAGTIEVESINTGAWHRLMLPNNAFTFATDADRDAVLQRIWQG